MRIRGIYVLTLRNIKRLILALAAAYCSICASVTTPADIVRASRISNAAQSLMSLQLSVAEPAARVVVPDLLYTECKALYFETKDHTAARLPRTVLQPAAQTASGFTADDRRMLRRTHDMVRSMHQCDRIGKPDRRPVDQRMWIDRAVRLYIQRHDVERRTGYTFAAACRHFWKTAASHFRDRKQYENRVAYDYRSFYDIDAEKAKIIGGTMKAPRFA